MPPVKMTRDQYEKQYGVKPVVQTEVDIDTTPAPERMTRAEYNAKYRPQPQGYSKEAGNADFFGDVAETKSGVSNVLDTYTADRQAIRSRVETGETTPRMGAFQTMGKGLLAGASALGELVMGGAKVVSPQSFEDRVKNTLGKDVEEIVTKAPENIKTILATPSEDALFVPKEVSDKLGDSALSVLNEVEQAYKTDANFRDTVDAAGGVVSWLTLPGAATEAKAVASNLVDATGDIAKAAAPTIDDAIKSIREATPVLRSQDKAISSQANDILKVEEKYQGLRNTNIRQGAAADESRARIAQSNVLEGAVDENGLIDTSEAVKMYKAQTIDGREDIVRKSLEAEGATVNLNEIRNDLRANLLDSGLEGGALAGALKGIERQIQGLAVRADAMGDVPLYKLQDAKISEYNSINFNTSPNTSIYKKTLARTYKEVIEAKSKTNVKELNQELAKFYTDIARLENLNGKRVEGGRLGKYGAQIVGTVVGSGAGAVGGGFGAAVGGMIGGELASKFKGKAMAGTFNRGINTTKPTSSVLDEAKANIGKRDLKTPDKKVGVAKNIKKTPEMVKVEAQIAKNVDLQKKAIKDGDFTLVAELKDIYENLVAKLKTLIEDYKKNGVPLGMSIRKTVTPESVAKKSAPEDIKFLNAVIDDVKAAKADPEANKILDAMGLGKATDDELVSFAKEVIDEADIAKNLEVKATNLVEEAKKYKSAELNYVYNTKKANLGDQDFAQDVEPAGRYMNVGFDQFPGGEGMKTGKVTFKNPLVLEWKTSRTGGWKTDLSERYSGKTGKELSQAIVDDGYDGVIAITGDNPREAVNLQEFRK